jgi:hypothetical protein
VTQITFDRFLYLLECPPFILSLKILDVFKEKDSRLLNLCDTNDVKKMSPLNFSQGNPCFCPSASRKDPGATEGLTGKPGSKNLVGNQLIDLFIGERIICEPADFTKRKFANILNGFP